MIYVCQNILFYLLFILMFFYQYSFILQKYNNSNNYNFIK